MKIAYVELDTHAEIAQNFMALMQDSKNFETQLFCTEKIAQRMGTAPDNISVVKPENLFPALKVFAPDLVIIGTAHRYFNIFAKVCNVFNSAVIAHNLNFTKAAATELLLSVPKKDRIFRLKLLLKEGLLCAPQIFNNVELLVLDKNSAHQNHRFLPVFYSETKSQTEESSALKIAVPGAVSQNRRDYRHILKKLNNYTGAEKIEVSFAGKATGAELQWLKTFDRNKISLQFFEDKISPEKFAEILRGADVLWCPVQRETEFFSIREIYGETKISGNYGDAIKFAKPAVFPADYPANQPFIFVEESNVFSQFSALKKGFEYDFNADFGKEKVLADLEKVLFSLIKP